MVFQDGAGQVDEKGRWRANVVFDNLIHKKEMPVTIGVFVNPGVLEAKDPATQQHRYNRSFEYDSLGDRYARFLVEELLPHVASNYAITSDPNLRAIGGSSSGAAAAFTAAWNRPDQFRRVLSFIGSYTGLRGADIYPTLIRKTEQKPLRVFLQDGSNDLNIYSGSWWLGNQEMASGLEYAGYDVKFVTGDQAHNGIHGSAILPDALRWLWKDWSRPIQKSKGKDGVERHWISQILHPDHDWELVSEGHQLTEGPSVDKQGNVYFTDIRASKIHKVDHATRKVSEWKANTGSANGMMFGPDGRLYVCQNGNKRIVAYETDGRETTLAEGVDSNDLAVTAKGEVYFSDPPGKRIWFIDKSGAKRVVHEGGLEFPNGVLLSPDQSKLAVADYRSKWVWLFEVAANGDLQDGAPFYRLETADEVASLADGMTFDTEGYLYVATRVGIQVCDQPGRVNAIISRPQATGPLTNVVFAGPELDWLYATAGDKVFRRKIRRTGVTSWKPVKPPQPRL
jgi:sugar lactone lactonase YvrE/enterochelin esterase-like enzyme